MAIFVDGAKRYKLGFPPIHTRGAIGYLSRLCGSTYGLIVKSFAHNPDGQYVDKPQGDSRKSGDAIQIYNHYEGGSWRLLSLNVMRRPKHCAWSRADIRCGDAVSCRRKTGSHSSGIRVVIS